MASSVSNTEQTSTIKNKIEEVSAAESSVIASGRPSSEAASQAQEGISTKCQPSSEAVSQTQVGNPIKSVVPKRCARQYKAPRWKSYHLPAVKYELLIYAQLFMAAIAMIAMKDIAMLPWNKVAKLREAVNRLNSLDLTDEEVDLIVDEFLKQDTDKRKCGLLNLSNAKTSQICPMNYTIFDYAPLTSEQLHLSEGLAYGEDIRKALKMRCCTGHYPSSSCPCGYKLIQGHCITPIKMPTKALTVEIRKEPCGKLGYPVSFDSGLKFSTIELISAELDIPIHLDVVYVCSLKRASRLSDNSVIHFNSHLQARCSKSFMKFDRKLFVVSAKPKKDKYQKNTWILCLAPKNTEGEWWHYEAVED